MKHYIKYFMLTVVILLCITTKAQVKVGNNPTTINTSAAFEVESTNKGVLLPRLTSAQRLAISNPVNGLLIYNSSKNCIEWYNGTSWFNPCGILDGPPAAPTNLVATSGNAQASIAFTSGASEFPITSYTVTSSPGGITGTGSASPITVTGLTNGTAYTFTVTATSTAGTSVASVPSNSVTPTLPPQPPLAPSNVTAVEGDGNAIISFTAPTSDSPITGYTVTSSPGGITVTGTSSPITVSGLTNGTSYTFTVTATSTAGSSVASTASNSVTPNNNSIFTFTSSDVKYLPYFSSGRTMNTDNNLSVEVNVTKVGPSLFSTNTVNGYSFSASPTFTNLGNQWVTLVASGTQSAYNSSGDNITITGIGATSVSKSVTIINIPKGSDFTTFTNGTQNFSSNTSCQNSLISANHTASTCSADVVVGANTYNVVLINGQCWMKQNLKEASTAPCSADINTGCNTWLNVDQSVNDSGKWGYYNTTTNGTAGWGTTEVTSGDGLLYQWKGAMNNSITERSKGVCPEGWHIPSDCEFMYLEHGLGMTIAEQTGLSGRTSGGVAGKIIQGGTTGFAGLLSGQRNLNGTFSMYNTSGVWWTSTKFPTEAKYYIRRLNSSSSVGRNYIFPSDALSVRCLKN
jgi:uncharacterized protein (TIGR02145 family)